MTNPANSVTNSLASSLSVARRSRDLEALRGGEVVDVLVVGGGITGAGVALDAASRGLTVALIERGDLAHGTSRWSSKLVHGGLRYLARGEVGIAYESARERGVLMTRTAPHLVRALPMVILADTPRLYAGLWAADLLRLAARTRRATLPRPRRLSRVETLRLVPGLRAGGQEFGQEGGWSGAELNWEGQLVDDARLVVAVARTAASYGARILTRCAALELAGDGARVRDELTGTDFDLRARAVINATGVWAGRLAPDVRMRPSRGTHLVVRSTRLGGLGTGLMIPAPGEPERFVLALPQDNGLAYVGLTDEPVDGVPEDDPRPAPHEVDFLLSALNSALAVPLRRDDLLGTFSGLRPLLDDPAARGRTSDLSRRHAVLDGPDGVITVVGGKLTTYRAMAEDAVDRAVAIREMPARRCRTRRLPLVGAAEPGRLDRVDAPARLIRRYGTEAPRVIAESGGDPALLRPLADDVGVTGAELLFGLRHEGALTADDLLDRRTRVGLTPGLRDQVARAAGEIVDAELVR